MLMLDSAASHASQSQSTGTAENTPTAPNTANGTVAGFGPGAARLQTAA